MTPQRLFTLRHLSQLLTTLWLEVETLQRPAPPVMLRRTRVSNPSVQTGEPNRTGGQSERAKTDLNDFKEFLVGSIVTGKDWAVWASGLGSFIRRWKGASIVAKRSLLHGVVPVPGRNVTQTGVQSTATARRRATSLRRRGRVAVGKSVSYVCQGLNRETYLSSLKIELLNWDILVLFELLLRLRPG